MSEANPNAGTPAAGAAAPPLLGTTAPTGAPAAGAPAAAAAPTGAPAAPAAADLRDWLPEEYRNDAAFKDFKDPAGLAKSYKHASSLVGLDKGAVLRLPADGDEAAMAEVFNRLGRPETPDKYEFPKLPGALIDGVEPAAREGFHKLGLSAKQAAGVMELYGGQITAAEQARVQRGDQLEQSVVSDLKREWGDTFEDKVHAANRAIAELGGNDLGRLFETTVMPDGTRMGQHPLLIRAFAAMGARLAEPGDLRGGGSGGGSAAMTPGDAQAEITRMRADPVFLREFSDPRHANYPAHKAAWDKMHRTASPAS